MESKETVNVQEKLAEISIKYEYEMKMNKKLTSENNELKAQIKRLWIQFIIALVILGALFATLTESALNKIEPRRPAEGYQLADSEVDYGRIEDIIVNNNETLESVLGSQGARSKLDISDAERPIKSKEIETMPSPISPDDFVGPMPSPSVPEDFVDPMPSPIYEEETSMSIPSSDKISEGFNKLNDKLIEKTEEFKSTFNK